MLRTTIYSTLAVLGLAVVAPAVRAQVTVFPTVIPGYQPNFRYQYGYGVYPSYYYYGQNPGLIVQPTIRVYVIEYRRLDWHYWQTFGRTYSLNEAQLYANYLGSLGFQSRVHLHPL
jgi:hypothetical protein